MVFGIHGMGLLSYEALAQRDYPVTLGIIIIASILSLLGNLLSDLSYLLDRPGQRIGQLGHLLQEITTVIGGLI